VHVGVDRDTGERPQLLIGERERMFDEPRHLHVPVRAVERGHRPVLQDRPALHAPLAGRDPHRDLGRV